MLGARVSSRGRFRLSSYLGQKLPGSATVRRGPGSRARTRAFTLIEVLVALVVLMIGVYGMIRIFPRGYSAIEASQQRTTAAQLAEAEIARWLLHPEALPDAIVATDYEGNLIPATLTNSSVNLQSVLVYGELAARLPGTNTHGALALSPEQVLDLQRLAVGLVYDPTDLTPSQFDAALGLLGAGTTTLHPNWQPNSLYLPRTVIGEQIDIRRLGAGNRTVEAEGEAGPGVPFYLLSHAPLDVLRVIGEDVVYVDIYDARQWRYIRWPGAAAAVVLQDREFTSDPDTGLLYFGPHNVAAPPPGYTREFKIDYSSNVGGVATRIFGARLETGPTGAGAATDPLDPLPGDPTNLQVYERLVPLTEEEYLDGELQRTDAPARRNVYYVDYETAISGRIEFPLVLQIAPHVGDITLAKVDYRVMDWQILVFDVEVPPDGTVQLPVNRIKGPTYTNPPRQTRAQEVARGIKAFYDTNGNEVPPERVESSYAYVVAVDRQSGEILTDHEGVDWPSNPWERRHRFRVNYRDGLLYFDYDQWEVWGFDAEVDTPERSGRTYRIFCRAQGDWAVQLMPAVRSYARAAPENGPPGPNYPYGRPGGPAVGGQTGLLTYAWGVPESRSQLFFPLSESGQTVSIDYYYKDADGNDIFVAGEVRSIGAPQIRARVQEWPVPYEWACPLDEQLAHEPNDWGPIAVHGLSLRTRATWAISGRDYTLQDLASALDDERTARATLSETWKQVVLTTYLSRAPI